MIDITTTKEVVTQQVESMDVEPQCSQPSEAKPATKKSTKRPTPKKKKRIVKTTKTTRVTKTKVVKRRVIRSKVKQALSKENKVVLREQRFRAWKADQFVIDTLTKRGWKYCGEPIPDGREDYPHSMYAARERGEIDKAPCLFWADDDDSKVLQGMNDQHLISSIPFADKALTKVFQQRMFNDYAWFPACFTLPKEKQALLEYTKEHPDSYWIAKPRDGYGGFGMCVFKAGSEDFAQMTERKTTFVVQRYMHNPYLFADKYKFHIRSYMVVTNADPGNVRAYLWQNAQIQFATQPFDLTQVEKSFNKYCHITNWKVNNEKKNKKYVCLNKDGIGYGTEWTIGKFIEHMIEHEPKFNERAFWAQLEKIASIVANKLMTSKHVQKGMGSDGAALSTNHFEIYGLDILMDDDTNLHMTEANTQPGLDFSDPKLADGTVCDEIAKANDVTEGIINDAITLLGIDAKKKLFSPFVRV